MHEIETITYQWGKWEILFTACESDWDPIDGMDSECLAWIRAQIDLGNPAAWFVAKVTASCGGFEGRDYLGGCSYESFDGFTNRDGYFPQMVRAAMLDAVNNADEIVCRSLEARRFLIECGETHYQTGTNL